MTVRANAAARRTDVAIVAEAQAVREVAARVSRPTEADVADIVEAAIVAAARTRSWVPDSTGRTELAGEVHTFVGTVVCASVR